MNFQQVLTSVCHVCQDHTMKLSVKKKKSGINNLAEFSTPYFREAWKEILSAKIAKLYDTYTNVTNLSS